jgi:hypothetical protein
MSRGIGRLSRRGLGAVAFLLGLMLVAMPARAQCVGTTCTVASASDLVSAITTVDNDPGHSYGINITADITLTSGTTLPALTTNALVFIVGNGHTIDGGGVQRGFLFNQGGAYSIGNLTIQNTVAQGGTGGAFRRRGCRARRGAVRRQRCQCRGQQCQSDLQWRPGRARRRGRQY